jgi:hypothetical protein
MSLPVELVEEIFSYLFEVTAEEILVTKSKRDLRSCALSCRALFRPAIRVLWRNVELIPLLNLLPGFRAVNRWYYVSGPSVIVCQFAHIVRAHTLAGHRR